MYMTVLQPNRLNTPQRMVVPSDFQPRTGTGSPYQDSTFVTKVRYTSRLPSSVKMVDDLSRDVLLDFLHAEVDAIVVQPNDVTKRAVAAEVNRDISAAIATGEFPCTFAGSQAYLKSHFDNSKSPLFGRTRLRAAVEKDIAVVGAFLKQVRECQGTPSDEFRAAILNCPCLGSLFHLHPGQIIAVKSYKAAGTEFLVSKSGEVYQLPVGTMMIFKGDRVIHRQPPNDNTVEPYKRGFGYDNRLLLRMAVNLDLDGRGGSHVQSRCQADF